MLITEPSVSHNLFAGVTSKLTDHFSGGPVAKGPGVPFLVGEPDPTCSH